MFETVAPFIQRGFEQFVFFGLYTVSQFGSIGYSDVVIPFQIAGFAFFPQRINLCHPEIHVRKRGGNGGIPAVLVVAECRSKAEWFFGPFFTPRNTGLLALVGNIVDGGGVVVVVVGRRNVDRGGKGAVWVGFGVLRMAPAERPVFGLIVVGQPLFTGMVAAHGEIEVSAEFVTLAVIGDEVGSP